MSRASDTSVFTSRMRRVSYVDVVHIETDLEIVTDLWHGVLRHEDLNGRRRDECQRVCVFYHIVEASASIVKIVFTSRHD
jgi:hypothetical protein